MMDEPKEPTKANRPAWDADLSHPNIIESLTTHLREVTDPEIGLDIIALGLIRNVKISEKEAEINMILTTPFCPYAPAMLEMTRKKAEEALGMPVKIDLGLEMWDFSMMEEGALSEWGMW